MHGYQIFRDIKRLWLLVICLSALLAGCTTDVDPSAKTDADKKVTIIHSLPSESMDPHNEWIALRAGVTETLVRLNEKMEVSPWLASAWEAKDERTWSFTIRDGIAFQDGTKLDAAAVKASFERGMEDSEALSAGLKLQAMEANGQELIFTTKEPHPAFPTELVHPTASIVSVAAEKKLGKEAFNKAPVGTGPFKVVQFIPGQEITLDRYDGYWDGTAKLSAVKFLFNGDANVRTLAFQSKQADIVYHLAPEALTTIESDQQLSVQSVTSLRTHYFTYNPQSASVSDIRVRRAIDKLIDRDTIVKDIMLGHALPANGPFNNTLPFGSGEAAQQLDQAEAQKLLESAGYKKNSDGKLEKDGKLLVLKLIAFSGINPELPLIPLLVQSEAAKVGITIEVTSVEYPDVYIKDHSDWDLSTSSYLTSPRGDGGSFLNSAYLPGGSYNAANVKVDNLEPILMELNTTGDVQKRSELTQQAVQLINEAKVHSFIIHPNILVGVHNRIMNWRPGAEEFYLVTNKMDVQ
ncbi:ABC transporter substrate-binding protein [Paenibacillus sp. 1011MAR3C5]|uniref:nickel ABC transporter substrate-binding protein n=1 Tax=Paenibacillus sp. 1011MAR3C5 TaxID=1675787 RepID=UPI000E6D18FB|nr:nickel ABC transporter substrate-binding protein [Paenibacillus sp. 1011MAR3C5]RJE87018.1 ABC transporter substrate-binding protein [Paenibacillus sp. 1011MAR3C5]